ncbi:uncharacterized protein J3R85_008080 [Psidium guajava]|nr:uncharacterized protein J3R85_008080 [Psidium guajava]
MQVFWDDSCKPHRVSRLTSTYSDETRCHLCSFAAILPLLLLVAAGACCGFLSSRNRIFPSRGCCSIFVCFVYVPFASLNSSGECPSPLITRMPAMTPCSVATKLHRRQRGGWQSEAFASSERRGERNFGETKTCGNSDSVARAIGGFDADREAGMADKVETGKFLARESRFLAIIGGSPTDLGGLSLSPSPLTPISHQPVHPCSPVLVADQNPPPYSFVCHFCLPICSSSSIILVRYSP